MKNISLKNESLLRKKGNKLISAWLLAKRNLLRFLFVLTLQLKKQRAVLYLVGGMVRDILEGIEQINDIDMMVTGIGFEELGEVLNSLRTAGVGVREVVSAGKLFPVYRVSVYWNHDPIDIAIARTETSTGSGHSDFVVSTEAVSSIEDSRRRDFSFNAIFYRLFISRNVLSGRIVDYQHGLKALIKREIVAVGNPYERFEEDPLRMLRAIRQKNQRKGFYIEKKTWQAIKDAMPRLLKTISGERIAVELLKSLKADAVSTFDDLMESRALSMLLPEMFKEEDSFSKTRQKFAALSALSCCPSSELLFSCLLSELAVNEISKKIDDITYKRKLIKKSAKPNEGEFYKIDAATKIIVRMYLPQQKQLISILSSLTALVNIDKIDYPLAIIEELFASNPLKDDIIMLYNIHQTVSLNEKIDLDAVINNLLDVPKLISGEDLASLKINAGPHIKTILRCLRQKHIMGQIVSRESMLAEAVLLYRQLTSDDN